MPNPPQNFKVLKLGSLSTALVSMSRYVSDDFNVLKQTPLPKNTEEYGAVEYLLRLSLSSVSVKVMAVYPISNPHLTMQFERRTKVTWS